MTQPRRIVGIIPSRLASTRVPQKPLVEIEGLPMVVHVYLRAKLSPVLDDLYVATDNQKIKEKIEQYGGKAIMTSSDHNNGTERLAEAAKSIACDYVVLINGDEPLLNPEHISVSVNALLSSDAQASILVNNFKQVNSPADFKVILNQNDEVMYISRGDIPYDAYHKVESRLKAYHILTFKKSFLQVYSKLKKANLENIEGHEHLRILEHGYKIKAARVKSTAISVDTPDDLAYVRNQMLVDKIFPAYKPA